MPTDLYECYLRTKELDDFYLAANTSFYNIYNYCYNSSKESNTINMGCEDESATITYFNDPHFRENWNIVGEKKW